MTLEYDYTHLNYALGILDRAFAPHRYVVNGAGQPPFQGHSLLEMRVEPDNAAGIPQLCVYFSSQLKSIAADRKTRFVYVLVRLLHAFCLRDELVSFMTILSTVLNNRNETTARTSDFTVVWNDDVLHLIISDPPRESAHLTLEHEALGQVLYALIRVFHLNDLSLMARLGEAFVYDTTLLLQQEKQDHHSVLPKGWRVIDTPSSSNTDL